MKKHLIKAPRIKLSGFSLIELMISLLVASIIMIGVVEILSKSRYAFKNNEEISFIQENARFSFDFLSRDIRMAGYKGCASLTTTIANTIENDLEGFISPIGLQGFDGETENHHEYYDGQVSTHKGVDGAPDSIIVRRGSFEDEFELKEHRPASNALDLWDVSDFAVGTPIVMSNRDCSAASYFIVSGGGNDSITHGGKGNCSDTLLGNISCKQKQNDDPDAAAEYTATGGGLKKPYAPGSRVMRLLASAYYIGDSTAVPGVPALKRETIVNDGGVLTTRSEELAIGVEDLQILYGYDSNADGEVEGYVTAKVINDKADPEEWNKILAVKLDLTFRSEAELAFNNSGVEFQGVAVADKFMRQLVSTTINVRNNRGGLL